MQATLATLIDRIDAHDLPTADVIEWGCPIPAFGDIKGSKAASLGLNPSSREFVDSEGTELDGPKRRFHTLRSLGISSWMEADSRHLNLMVDACCSYFDGNPYDLWFRRLEVVISGAGASYYKRTACHLDLIPYATMRKWGELRPEQRSLLLASAGNALGSLLRDSPIVMLVLNGSSVVELFQKLAGIDLESKVMPAWSLPRQNGNIDGMAYWGKIETLAGEILDREVLVVGYNHNLQSSYGVTNKAISSIGSWVAQKSAQMPT